MRLMLGISTAFLPYTGRASEIEGRRDELVEREEREEPEALDDREELSSPPSSGCPGATTPKPSAFPSPRERMLWDAVNASLPTELSPTDSCADTAGPASAAV
jgi:hypothetical protein